DVGNSQQTFYEGYERIINGYSILSRFIKEVHQTLMSGARGSVQSSGNYRKIQNFIGPTNKIADATYIPVPADEIETFMENLEFFINHHPYGEPLTTNHIDDKSYIFNEDADPLIKAAIMHAQFESIHPF